MAGIQRFLYSMNQKRDGVIVKILFPGWVVIIASLLIGAVAYNTGNNLVFIILSATLSLIIVSGILSKFNLRKLSTSLEGPAYAHSGQEIFIRITIDHSRFSLPIFGIGHSLEIRRVDSLSGRVMDGASVFSCGIFFAQIPPRKTSSRSMTLPFLKRGIYRINIVNIKSGYPFGFFLKQSPCDLQKNLTIHPAIIPLEASTLPLNLVSGPQSAPRAGDGVDLLSIRDYHEGDPLKRIHWKASAKIGRYLIRELAKEQSPIITLFFPTHATPDNNSRKYEWAISLTASICKLLLEKNFAVGFSSRYSSILPQKSPYQLGYIVDHLTRLPENPDWQSRVEEPPIPAKTFYLRWQDGITPKHEKVIDLRIYFKNMPEDFK